MIDMTSEALGETVEPVRRAIHTAMVLKGEIVLLNYVRDQIVRNGLYSIRFPRYSVASTIVACTLGRCGDKTGKRARASST